MCSRKADLLAQFPLFPQLLPQLRLLHLSILVRQEVGLHLWILAYVARMEAGEMLQAVGQVARTPINGTHAHL